MIVFIAIVIITLCSFYRYEIRPMSNNNTIKEFEVANGDSWYSIGPKLYENKLIRSYKFFKIYIKLFSPTELKAGIYNLSEDMSLPTIVETLEGASTNPNDVKISFKEGINFRKIATLISENTNNTYDDVMALMSDQEYLNSLINDYWFIGDEIKNPNIYYPLEGYLFPDTYIVNKNSDVKTIFKLLLDRMDKELSKYKNDIENTNYSVHQILTLASIVELEAGNASDRTKVAGVFYNRINTSYETLGSDVTAYYGAKMDDWSNGLGSAETACNPYNTRLNSKCPINGLPVGPIAIPSSESIKATIFPTKTDMLFFVADCSGKTYLSKTYAEHNRIINDLKTNGNWCDN